MATATFVKKARKDYPDEGIKKGDSYYWWAFQYGPVIRSKTAPRPSQLTHSEFLSTVYGVNERLEDLSADDDLDSIHSEVDEICEELTTLKDETEEKWMNMPDQLQSAPTGELLQGRVDALDEMISNLEGVDFDGDIPESLEGNEAGALEAAKEEVTEEEWKALSEDEKKAAIADAIEAREDEIREARQAIVDEASGYVYEGE